MSETPSAYDPHASATRWSDAWDGVGLYRADPAKPGPAFSVVIPPPNITGSLHMGHALNNTLQDVLVRYKRMDGYNVVWVPGTDHAGIATQWVVRRQLEKQGVDYRTLGREGFVEKIWKWKAESGGTITNQLKKLGVSTDWSREQFTMSAELTRAVTEHFVKLYEDGLIYKGTRLINWDPLDQTALSDLEVEHEETQGELFEFAYKLSDGSGEIVVATTRPETMLGDTAVAVHPDDERYKHLIGQTVDHPFVDRKIRIIADGILVDMAFGTGVVKVTPAHDFNDYATGKRHDLQMITILTPDGKINDNGGKFVGLDRFDARTQVKAALEELGLARGTKPHTLAIGKSQRSGAVVEPMLSTQWFVKMAPLGTPALAAVKYGHTRFVPKQWENTYYAWLNNLQDWCISRQLWWGHRIPAWECAACSDLHVAREAPTVCKTCGKHDLRQDEDVLDTWFSSALWPMSVFGWPDNTADLQRYYPTSVLVTGFDIIFFWVARMMFAGIHFTGTVPFKDVYIHALVRDKNGDKMSKTKGNVVDPLDVISKWGADAFRFTLCAFAAQGRDVLWDEKRVENYHRFETKIWSALRFCLMHREGYDPEAPMAFGPYERWIRARTGVAAGKVRAALDAYKFNEAATEIHSFVWGEFCDWYLELAKPVLYDDQGGAAEKNGTKHVLYETMNVIARMIHPMMPFLSEEVWHAVPHPGTGAVGFVATAPFPRAEDFNHDEHVLRDMGEFQAMVTEARRIRADMDLAPRTQLEVHIADEGLRARLAHHERALRDMGKLDIRAFSGRPKGYATGVVSGHECVIPLAGVVDFAAEVKRLEKVIAKIDKDVNDLTKRLGNDGFVARAPVEVVEEFKAKLAEATVRRDTLKASQERMKEAMS